eukprot:COSAG01_NODE_2282_length_8004_cov_3.883491_3_plen_53_part_00
MEEDEPAAHDKILPLDPRWPTVLLLSSPPLRKAARRAHPRDFPRDCSIVLSA